MPLQGRKRRASAVLGGGSQATADTKISAKNTNHDDSFDDATTRCSFCRSSVAAVAVRTLEPIQPRSRTTTTVTRPYCLLHYYTTPASRVPTKYVTLLDPEAYDAQYPAAQKLFAEAFVQLQQELSETMARSATANQKNKDPLAVLHQIHKKAQRRPKAPPVKPVTKRTSSEEGGFLKQVTTPERLVRTQQAQARKQEALLKRMERAAAVPDDLDASHRNNIKPDISKRRKSSRKSIWNSVIEHIDKKDDNDDGKIPATTAAAIHAASEMHGSAVCSVCQSNRVRILASNTARDVRKGEIWGGSGRDEVSTRVQCLDCGKMWNEED